MTRTENTASLDGLVLGLWLGLLVGLAVGAALHSIMCERTNQSIVEAERDG